MGHSRDRSKHGYGLTPSSSTENIESSDTKQNEPLRPSRVTTQIFDGVDRKLEEPIDKEGKLQRNFLEQVVVEPNAVRVSIPKACEENLGTKIPISFLSEGA